ncbi:P-loop NTPase fold protein [Xanthomonas campestris]|uniref:P-loop NTPase fold protein n=1 Tax=Xanthomonas campestris TaxID=339 RepID=UPI0011157827|nr:P-loop NTPase fold protein [Xanthomonas campestris]MCF8828024.1 hypothetical protein [Xanthomonas campestris pv. raphani]MEA9839544.1 P-loop NTPase fold protein [Xanthomonas campestris pv. raphani]MEA9931924.1 P-loop NTPase fold protein [Xanthomonas campestris pv. raphani]QLC71318.1 hypothetical protein AD14011_18580 [Xanthomonas campestris pv. raphani]WDJ18650.1 hypothetical protein JH264_02435 [Xanthomonas campestris pv. raphani]
MSIDACKVALVDLLNNEELKVIALSGAWGTGKTELWKTIQRESTSAQITHAATASLFGVRNMNSLKMSAIQSAAFKDFKETTTGRSLQGLFSVGAKALRGAHSSFGALDDLALLLLPAALKGKLVVIDDIERKHKELTADEVLGFIDECCNRYGCRVLLILNEEKMADATTWHTFREKVIDAEVRLQTRPEEAFLIALQHTPSPYADEIRAVVARCGVSNIRILRRVIRACNLILKPHEPAHPSTLSRVIPSVVLLGFAHLRGIEDPPNLDFALTSTNPATLVRFNMGPEQNPLSEEEQAERHYTQWLQKVGLQFTDELEAEIVKFYRSGLPDTTAIGKLLGANEADSRRYTTQASANSFLMHCGWHHKRTDESLIKEAEELVEGMEYLDASMATSLCSSAADLPGGSDVGERIIDGWLAAFHARIAISDQELDWHVGHPVRSPLHPRIREAVSAALAARGRSVGIFEICQKIHRDQAWGKAESNQLKDATAASFIEVIRAVEGNELIAVMSVMLDIAKDSLEGHHHFGSAGGQFVDACKQILGEEPGSRLAKLIKNLFKSDGMEAVL